MKRVILHWTAGSYAVSWLDKAHYHFIIDGNGSVCSGRHPVSANEVLRYGKYAAHTLGCNTGSIGISIAAMAGAIENPFNAGRFPLKKEQFYAAAALTARLCRQYGIEVTARTVLSHAEVQSTLGIKQRGKWDIARLPWDLTIKGATQCGDSFRNLVREHLRTL